MRAIRKPDFLKHHHGVVFRSTKRPMMQERANHHVFERI
jgi:hypothetical protein